MAASERDAKLFAPGPKRILSLDGGGVRGIVSLAFLERIERLLCVQAGRPVVLADHFHLVGGTSTGAIIATALSLGMPVHNLIEIYRTLSQASFRGWRFHGGFLISKFRAMPLMREIRRQVGDETLGSEKLRTGLAIVAKHISTGSVWVLHNNPRGRYFDSGGDGAAAVANKDLPLAQLLRASTAAPTFFAPMRIEIAPGFQGVFVDGGVSPFNNPSLLMFMLATLSGYGFRWPNGAERLRLVSVGTGRHPISRDAMPGPFAPAANLALLALRSVIDDCSALGETMLQWLATSPTRRVIDGEIGDLAGDQIGAQPALHYVRYNVELSSRWIWDEFGVDVGEREILALARMDNPKSVPRLFDLARMAAEKQVLPEHFG